TLADARAGRADVDGVGREPLGGDLEGGPRPGAGLVEQVDDRLPAQRRHLLDVALRDFLERRRRIENGNDLVPWHALEPEQMPLRERHGRSSLWPSALDDDLVHAVRFREVHRDTLAAGRGEVLADVVGTNRELAVAAVDQD